jgi:hypothetical protein
MFFNGILADIGMQDLIVDWFLNICLIFGKIYGNRNSTMVQ